MKKRRKLTLPPTFPSLGSLVPATFILVGCSGDNDSTKAENIAPPASRQSAAGFTPSSHADIDTQRLLDAGIEPGQWLTEGRDFGKGHYSLPDAINRGTIKDRACTSSGVPQVAGACRLEARGSNWYILEFAYT